MQRDSALHRTLAGGAAAAYARAPAPTLGSLLPRLLTAALLATFTEASAQPPCIVAAGASTFNLTELGGGSAPILTATEPYRRGWVYMFSLCGDVAPDAYCATAPPAAVLQDTPTQCHTLGASATRAVVVAANGVSVSFSGGEGGRKSIILVECADVEKPFLVSWTEGPLPFTYVALVRARAGCAVECPRTAAGAVCGGEARGACITGANGTDPARCLCIDGHAGIACGDTARPRASLSSRLDADQSAGLSGPTLGVVIAAITFFAMIIIRASVGFATPTPVQASACDVSSLEAEWEPPDSASPLVGRLGTADFPAEGGGRYVLYASFACPWSCRVLAALALKGLKREVAVVVCAPTWRATRPDNVVDNDRGWVFRARAEPGSPDAALAEVPEREPVFGAETVREVYERCVLPAGVAVSKFTLPLLVDSRTRRAVCNNSGLLLRDLGGPLFNACGARFPSVDLCPAELDEAVHAASELGPALLCEGVYRCGFARSQAAYDVAARDVLARLRFAEARLVQPESDGFLVGGRLTEADVQLFCTLVCWDVAFASRFKTSFASVRASPVLLAFVRRVHGARGGEGGATVGEASVRLNHVRLHHFASRERIGPVELTPLPHPDEDVELLAEAGALP